MRTEFLWVFFSVLRVTSGPRVNLAGHKSALNPPVVYSTDRSKVVVPVLVLLFVALWFILRGDLFYVLPCVILLLAFISPFSIAITSLGEERANLFVRLFDFRLFGFVGFLFLLASGKGCGLWLWHSLDFSLTIFMPPPALAGVGHIAFRRDVTSVRAYVRMCVCHVRNQVQVYLQV